MITAETLRSCDARGLLASLGYDVMPVAIAPEEWRRAGLEITWSDDIPIALAVRLPRLDVYIVEALVDDGDAGRFLRALAIYNVVTKPVLIAQGDGALALYDLSSRRELRRLDVDRLHPSPHAVDRINLLAAGDDPARVFDRALDRESLTRQFFERFRSSVRDVAAALREQLPGERRETLDSHALLLLSRLLFLYFIQQKGWLNGERRFLVDRLDAAVRGDRELFSTVLLPLFFGCLNTPLAERSAGARRLGAVPYLNGGLFEPSAFEQRHPELHLPNALLRRVIDDGFEKFTFSIDERDAAGSHVDPEMLGLVFESLMAEEERLASGSFYTPRAIVNVLVSRAIEEWLGFREGAGEAESRVMLRRLEGITVLDPTCGSGAFLLSALAVISRLTHVLASQAGEDVPPGLRQRIVERALYGVDLKAEAVRLCELRLWLAIVAGSDATIEDVPPLPNLDRNILQGNSLFGPTDFLGQARGDVYHEWVHALHAQEDLVARYRRAPHAERPLLARMIRAHDCSLAEEMLQRAIDLDEEELLALAIPQRDLFGRALPPDNARCMELQQRIRTHLKLLDSLEHDELAFFSYDVHFAPVLARGGFDVVTGNPPWVRNGRIDVPAKRMLVERYRLFRGERGERAAFHQPDLSLAFFERAHDLAYFGGVVALLLPAKVLNAAYAAPLRRMAQSELGIVAIDDWSEDARRHFDADTFPLGIVTRKRRNAENCVEVTASGQSFRLPQSRLTVLGSEWSLVPPEISEIVARLHTQHLPLAEALGRCPVMGVKTGANDAFFLDVAAEREDVFVTTDNVRIPRDCTRPVIRGRDVQRYIATESIWMLWPPREGWKKPPRWLERHAAARGVDAGSLRLQSVRPEHAGLKVVWKDLSRGLRAATARAEAVPNQTLYLIDATSPDEAAVLAALLNSTIVNALALCIAERAKDFHYRYFGRTVARIPLPQVAPSDGAWSRLLRCARRGGAGEDVTVDVDLIACALYGVSVSEHDRVAAFVARRLGYSSEDHAVEGQPADVLHA
jgi:N-6 DNA Methylase